MSESAPDDTKKMPLSLGGKGTLSLKGGAAAVPSIKIRQTLAQGRGNTVAVEVRRKRGGTAQADDRAEDLAAGMDDDTSLSPTERAARLKILEQAAEEDKRRREEDIRQRVLEAQAELQKASEEAGRPLSREELRARELEELKKIEDEEKQKAVEAERTRETAFPTRAPTGGAPSAVPGRLSVGVDDDDAGSVRSRLKRNNSRTARKDEEGDKWKSGRLTVNQVLNESYDKDRGQSLASVKRARAKAKKQLGAPLPAQKILHEVIVPETITVQELANRMSERGGDVIKTLMKMGVMATINQVLDADTAELVISEFGHTIKRVTDADIEIGLDDQDDEDGTLLPRAPVVTIMGHVDHGKTSLLDALRSTDVVSGEAGGITQHIGAYQVSVKQGAKITFLDTPGHAAFSEMRARGANVTDIVVLVVAANDSLMPQTIEAINHAKSAKVPIIVAINKIDLPDANPMKVKQDLLSHELVVEDMGGDVLCIEISAKQKKNLDKLEDAILLQAEVLNLRTNPNRAAVGTVVEAKMEQGRGSVATILVQKGTLRQSDIFVVGSEWGRVRAIMNDRGQQQKEAYPGEPVEVIGLNGTPEAGDKLVVVGDEAKAREIADYRLRKKRNQASVNMGSMSFDQLLAQSKADAAKKEMAVIIKADVHGSVEAIVGSLQKLTADNLEVSLRVLHSGVGGITESDITLARATGAAVIGFNVRANAQAREQAQKAKIEIRYYNIIYNLIDDIKAILGGLLSPAQREEYLGQAQIRQVFTITKSGKVAGCMVTAGSVKRGAKVRLLRDDIVIHEGTLKTLKRFKDEVKEVREGMECGMAFEHYDDIKDGDIIECYDLVSEARTL